MSSKQKRENKSRFQLLKWEDSVLFWLQTTCVWFLDCWWDKTTLWVLRNCEKHVSLINYLIICNLNIIIKSTTKFINKKNIAEALLYYFTAAFVSVVIVYLFLCLKTHLCTQEKESWLFWVSKPLVLKAIYQQYQRFDSTNFWPFVNIKMSVNISFANLVFWRVVIYINRKNKLH